jgi:hypothetical protein
VRTKGAEVDRAWTAVELTTSEQSDEFTKLGGHLWKPLRKLMAKAKSQREQAAAGESIRQGVDTTNSGPQSFMSMDLGVNRLYPQAQVPEFDSTSPQHQFPGSWQPVQQVEFSPTTNSSGANQPTNYHMAGVDNVRNLSPGDLASVNVQFGLNDAWNNVNTIDSNETTAMGDDSLNWATWDDMVQEFGLQNSGPSNGQTSETVPSFFGSSTSWY